MIKKGWKCLCRKNGKLYSLVMDDSIARVRYLKGKWVKPNRGCGPLAVFLTKMQAEFFMSHGGSLNCIKECEYKPSKKRSLFYKPSLCPLERMSACFPVGTRFADAVKIL